MTNNEQREMAVMFDNFLTINEICRLLKVSRGTVCRWIKRSQLRSYKVGRLVRVNSRDLGLFIGGVRKV